MHEIQTARGDSAVREITTFDYPVCGGAPHLPAWDGWVEVFDEDRESQAHLHGGPHDGVEPESAHGDKLADPLRKSFEAGRGRGQEEGRLVERETQAAQLAAENERHKRELVTLAASFASERDKFLHSVEQEVVKLALAVAARILRREAQMDPLLLAGAVRVALGQLAGSCEVRLKVPAAQLELWSEAIALVPNLNTKPSVVAGDGMRLGDCVIESKAGTVDLGVRSQLGEIERGFFDRSGSSDQEPFIAPGRVSAGAEA